MFTIASHVVRRRATLGCVAALLAVVLPAAVAPQPAAALESGPRQAMSSERPAAIRLGDKDSDIRFWLKVVGGLVGLAFSLGTCWYRIVYDTDDVPWPWRR